LAATPVNNNNNNNRVQRPINEDSDIENSSHKGGNKATKAAPIVHPAPAALYGVPPQPQQQPEQQPPQQQTTAAAATVAPVNAAEHHTYIRMVDVTIVKAKGLPTSWRKKHRPNPFVSLELGGKVQKTSIKLHPGSAVEWQETFTFSSVKPSDSKAALKIISAVGSGSSSAASSTPGGRTRSNSTTSNSSSSSKNSEAEEEELGHCIIHIIDGECYYGLAAPGTNVANGGRVLVRVKERFQPLASLKELLQQQE